MVSKENYTYIMDMIDLCIELGVDEISLLELVVEGNAKDKDIQITDEEELILVRNIAEKYNEVKDKIRIKPKFTMPIANDYCKEVLNLDYPNYEHGCGAGSNFAFINNKGELYPCDRLKNIDIDKSKLGLLNNSFYSIWSEDGFEQAFELTMGDDYYKKYYPCNKCKHLRKSCVPCFVNGLNDSTHYVSKCEKYFKLLEERNNG